MKLKTRLNISFLIMAFLPIFMFIIIFMGVLKYNYIAIDKYYGIHGTNIESIYNPLKLFYAVSDKLCEELKVVFLDNPEKIYDMNFIDRKSKELKSKATLMVILAGENEYYLPEGMDFKSFIGNIKNREFLENLEDETVLYINEYKSIYRHFSFEHEGTEYNVYLFTHVEDMLRHVKNVAWESLVIIMVILCAISGALIGKIHDATIVPLTKLRQATVNIKEGNLDFELVKEGDDVIAGLFEDFEDMRKRLKENADEKLEMDRESKELISNISHDLKTPITAIKGYVEGLVDGVAVTDEMRDRYLKTIYRKAMDMDRLINELTLYSKIDNNRVPYKFEKVMFNDFFYDCADSLKVELEAKNIGFEFYDMTDGGICIIADVEQLSRIVNNIISNSIKYMNNSDGKIIMKLRDEVDFVRVEIIDNGQGIKKSDLPYIFDRFYRSDASRNSSTGGSGIGLAIVKKIIEDHGGRIFAESREGQGTKMIFEFRKYVEEKK